MDFHKDFLEFTQNVLATDLLDRDPSGVDLHALLAPIADESGVHDLMCRIPDSQIAEVLGWAITKAQLLET